MKKSFLIILGITAVLSFACENNDKNEGSMRIDDFSVLPESDTVPCRVNVIYSTTSKGFNKYLFIHEGAYYDEEFTFQKDSSQLISQSTEEIKRTDTLKLYYNMAGVYKISLELAEKKFIEEIKLQPSK